MVPDALTFHARARRAYEWGQFTAALRAAWPLLPLVGGAMWLGCSLACLAFGATAAAALSVGLGWRGAVQRRAAGTALLAAVAPVLLPLAASPCGTSCCEPAALSRCLLACLVGGAAGGVLLGIAAVREKRAPLAFLAAGAPVTLAAGSLGCWIGGIPGLVALVVSVLATALPVHALGRRLAS